MIEKLLKSYFPLQEESLSEFHERYTGYGNGLYDYLAKHQPEIYDKITLYRSLGNQQMDSLAYYENGVHSFVVQLEPEGEVIVLWNEEIQTEYGTWEPLDYRNIVEYIQVFLLVKS